MANEKIFVLLLLLGLGSYSLLKLARAVSVCPSREINVEASGRITSPEYPGDNQVTAPGYPGDVMRRNGAQWECELTLKVPPTKQIKMTMTALDLQMSPNCTKDGITIIDNQWSENETLEITQCGRHFYSEVRTVERIFPKRHNLSDIIVRFTTDGYDTTGEGFCLTYELIDKPQNTTPKCFSSLGMEDGRIKDFQITVSSVKKETTATGQQARLRNNLPRWGAWCPENIGPLEYFQRQSIQINLLNLTEVTGIAIQGREYNRGTEFVKQFMISYSKDGRMWINYNANSILDTHIKIFRGNADATSVVINKLNLPITTRHIRIHPDYDEFNIVCMRLELYGCELQNDIEDSSTNTPNANTIATSVGAGASILVILVIFLVILKHKRRYKASKTPVVTTPSGTIEAPNRSKTGPSHQQQEQVDPIPVANEKIVPYREIKIPSNTQKLFQQEPEILILGNEERIVPYREIRIPSSIHMTSGSTSQDKIMSAQKKTQVPYSGVQFTKTCSRNKLEFNRQESYLRRRTTNGADQKVLQESCYVIPAQDKPPVPYHVVPITTPCGYTKPDMNTPWSYLKRATASNGANQKALQRESGCVIPAQEKPPMPYHVVPITTPSGYTEPDMNTPWSYLKRATASNGANEKALQRESGYVIPAQDKPPTPYHIVPITTPSGYTEPDMSYLKRATASNGANQKALQRELGYVIPAQDKIPTPYLVVQITTPSGYTELNIQNRRETNGGPYQHLLKHNSGYVIPADGKIKQREEVQITTPSGYTELNKQDRRETNGGPYQHLLKHESGYVIPADGETEQRKVDKITTPSSYTELNKQDRRETTGGPYQKLLKHESGYVIPTDARTNTGYTELADSKREQEDNHSYQKLIKNRESLNQSTPTPPL